MVDDRAPCAPGRSLAPQASPWPWRACSAPGACLALTFAIGAGTAVVFPAWAAATPELVPRGDVVQAVALNGVGFNLARALGPALGGLVMAAAGPAAAFALNALGLLAPRWALPAWSRPSPPRSRLPPERLQSAVRAGTRFAAAVPAMRAAILRACTFFLFASAVWRWCRSWCASRWTWGRRPSAGRGRDRRRGGGGGDAGAAGAAPAGKAGGLRLDGSHTGSG